MNPIIPDLAISAGLGAGFQVASEVLKMGHGIVDIFGKTIDHQIRRNEAAGDQARQTLLAQNLAANDASKRGTPWVRNIIAVIIVVAAFVLSYVNGWFGVITSIVTEKEPWLNLFSILRFGGGTKVVEAQGFILPPDFWESVLIVLFFFFGIGGVKTGKRVF